jgi:hypothetical protein
LIEEQLLQSPLLEVRRFGILELTNVLDGPL